jgi:putative Mn2+ efflux pump MntP
VNALWWLLAGVGVWIIANLIAQRVYPTLNSDKSGQRVTYRFLILGIALVLSGALVGMGYLFYAVTK